MSVTVISRNYSTRNYPTGNSFPLFNNGQIVTEVIGIEIDYNFESSTANQIVIAAENQLQVLGLNWSDLGFKIGDSINITGTVNNGGTSISYAGTPNYTISNIQGDLLTTSTDFVTTSPTAQIGQVMPSPSGSGGNTSFLITNVTTTVPAELELYHNLVDNSATGGFGSLFDGEVNRFKVSGTDTMPVTSVLSMAQQGNKSGGTYIGCDVERIATNQYEFTIRYANPYKFEDADFNEPSFFAGSLSLKPIYRFNCYPQANNPNSVLTVTDTSLLGNIGWLDENFNQGVNNFTVDSVTFTDTSGNVLSEVDYSQSTDVEIVISSSAAILAKAEVEFYLIPANSVTKNKLDSQGDLIHLSAFFNDSTGSPTTDSNLFGSNAAYIVTTNHTVTTGATDITISFRLVPNAAFTSLVGGFASNDRRYRITATVESTGGTSTANDAVSLICHESLMEQAPIASSPYDKVTFQGFYNHAQDISTGVSELIYNGCTEDDMVYVSRFNLEQNETFESLNLSILVERNSDGAFFNLITKTINLSNYVINTNGEIQINYFESTPQSLDASDRNQLSVGITGNSSGSLYEVRILWSLLANWRYWIAQNNALVDFFDLAEPNNGQNAEWMRYLRVSGYTLKLKCELIDTSNVGYYWGSSINLQDYEDTPDVTTDITYYDSSGNLQPSLIAGQEMTVRADHTLTSGSWSTSDVWGWIAERPKEGDPRRIISTVWDWSSQNSPLKPQTGQTKATLSFPSANVARIECLVDTSLITSIDNTFISRIEEPIDPKCIPPWTYMFNYLNANAASEGDYVTLLETYLNATNYLEGSNVCCPECRVTNVDGDTFYVWAFGSKALIDSFLATLTTSVCCEDYYGISATCEATFDAQFDSFATGITGDIAAMKAKVPSQINVSGVSFSNLFTLCAQMINNLTTDGVIRYQLMDTLLDNGIRMECYDSGTKIITGL